MLPGLGSSVRGSSVRWIAYLPWAAERGPHPDMFGLNVAKNGKFWPERWFCAAPESVAVSL